MKTTLQKISKMKEKILSLTAQELLNEEIKEELVNLFVALGDVMKICKIPRGFGYNEWGKIIAFKDILKEKRRK